MPLAYLAVQALNPTAWAELVQFHSAWVVTSVFLSMVCPLSTLRACQIYEDPDAAFFSHGPLFFRYLGDDTGAHSAATLSNGEP
jgi:hypothetical protein